MDSANYYVGVKYEAMQEYITQLIAFLMAGTVDMPQEQVKQEVDELVSIKKVITPDVDLTELKDELVRRSIHWGFQPADYDEVNDGNVS